MVALLAIFITIIIALLMHGLFPDVTARPMRAVPHKDKESIRHEVLLCATVATLSFVVFQVLDLQDSISAQAASILILFSLCFKAAGTASWQRIIGTLIGFVNSKANTHKCCSRSVHHSCKPASDFGSHDTACSLL